MGASFTTASAYIADVSTPEKRAQNFGMIGAAFGIGFIIGPVLGGLLGSLGTRVPFLVAAILSLINFIYGYFILPESLKPEFRRKFEWRRANPVGALLRLRRYPVISGLVFSLVLLYITMHAVNSNWSFFTMERFGWDEKMVGISLGLVGALYALVNGFLIRKFISKYGNEKSLYLGLIFHIIGFILFGVATEGWMALAICVVYSLGAFAGPALQGIISTQAPNSEQGELQGALTSLMSVTSVIGPLIMTNIFAYFTKKESTIYLPGAPMFLGAVLLIIATIAANITLKKRYRHQQAK